MTFKRLFSLIITLIVGLFFSVAHAEEPDGRSIDEALKRLLQGQEKSESHDAERLFGRI